MVDFADPYRREGDLATPKLRFGISPYIHFYAVFPHLETIGKTAECRIFKKWHDDVVLPAFREVLRAMGHAYHKEYPPTHKLALMDSECERVEMMRPDAPLAPIRTRVNKASIQFSL